MAQVSPPHFERNLQRYVNEMTPPEKLKSRPHPQRMRKYSPDLTLSISTRLAGKFERLNFNDSDDSIMHMGLNEGYIENDSNNNENKTNDKDDDCDNDDDNNNNVNKGKNGSLSERTELLSFEESFSVSSNGYASNSCANDSSILNSSEDDHPDTSTPQHLIASNSKYKTFRPPDLVIEEATDENNQKEMEDLAQYSPVRSPFPLNTSDDSLFGNDDTPEPLRFDTPPKGAYLKETEMKLVHLLKRYGLSHFAFIFVEQEVDVELFLTLNDQDLQEIGIKRNTDRNTLLSVISDCNTRLVESNN